MLHEIKYRIITIYKEKQVAFWSLVFPIILGTLFSMAFGNLGKDIDTIKTALIVEDTSENAKTFKKYLEEVAKADSDILKVEVMSEKKAVDKLKAGDILGIFYAKEEPELTVSGSGIEASVLKEFLSEYNQNTALLTEVAKNKPEKFTEIVNDTNYFEMSKEVGISGKKVDGVTQYYFSLIAMACLFGGFVGNTIGMQLQANIDKVAVRRNLSSYGKFKMILGDTVVGWGIQFLNVSVCLMYLKYILKVDIGSNLPKMFIIGAVGSLIGVAAGILVGCLGKMSKDAKTGIITSVSLVCSFLAGLMIGGMKGVIEKYCPIVNKINPAALISDAMYSIDIYNEPARFNLDMTIMTVMAIVFTVISFILMRRKRYDSI